MPPPRVVLFCRYPEAGRCKTRLIPAVGEAGAATVHKTLAENTVQAVRDSRLDAELHFTGADKTAFEAWLGEGIDYVKQSEGDLGARLQAAANPYPVIFIGSDCPDLSAAHLQDAAQALQTHDAVIGPAEDGGYWLLGLAEACDAVFKGIHWGTETVYSETLARFSLNTIEPAVLPTLADCDRPEDLKRWPELTA